MSHFGILASPVPGHLQPLCSIGRALQARGHRVTVFHMADARAECERLGVGFRALGENFAPSGTWAKHWYPIAESIGPKVLWRTVLAHRMVAQLMCQFAPYALTANGVDALLVDSMQFQGAAIAERVGIPFVSVDCTISLARDASGLTPPPFAGWAPASDAFSRALNRFGHRAVEWFAQPVLNVARTYRKRWQGMSYHSTEQTYSRALHLSPMPSGFDFVKGPDAPHFKRCGPFVDARRPEPSFDWSRLDGRPLVYASMGTLQNRIPALYEVLGEAAELTGAQWVVSFGAWRGDAVRAKLPKSVIACEFAPQLALLARANVCVTHAGANTTLEALREGVPVVALPIGNDQPAIAARIAVSGAGLTLSAKALTAPALASAVTRVMTDLSFRRSAEQMQAEIRALGGVTRAADEIEAALSMRALREAA